MALSDSYTKQEVKLAIEAMAKVWGADKPSRKVQEIAGQLEREMDAGEFDGTLDSAVICLECAGCEIVDEEAE